jgi:hypothetical protein
MPSLLLESSKPVLPNRTFSNKNLGLQKSGIQEAETASPAFEQKCVLRFQEGMEASVDI